MGVFPTTRWSVVLAAGRDQGGTARRALRDLCQAYWAPVYAYSRRSGRRQEDALDLTQGFFAYLLESHAYRLADPGRGNFRAFLKATFDHYAANEGRKERAQKRGGGAPLLSLDVEAAEAASSAAQVDSETPEDAFEREWARTLLTRAMDRLEGEMTSAGEQGRYARLAPLLTGSDRGTPYREIGRELDLSESAVKVAVHRMRRRFGALLREEVAQTVSDENRVDDELRHVFDVLSR